MVYALVGVFCIFSETVFPLCLKVSHDTLGVSRGAPGIAPVSWWWHHSRRRGGGALAGSGVWVVHHSRRRGDCSHVLTACIQATSLKGAQEVLWRLL
jgi:hypothetical protein